MNFPGLCARASGVGAIILSLMLVCFCGAVGVRDWGNVILPLMLVCS